MVLFEASGYRLPFPSFPTRRSSDLIDDALGIIRPALLMQAHVGDCLVTTAISNAANFITLACLCLDRESTRLNSSHVATSYAVFCLKKKIRSEALSSPGVGTQSSTR